MWAFRHKYREFLYFFLLYFYTFKEINTNFITYIYSYYKKTRYIVVF